METAKDQESKTKKAGFMISYPPKIKQRRKHIRLSSGDVAKLKKYRRLSGKDFIIDVMEDSAIGIKVFGRRKI